MLKAGGANDSVIDDLVARSVDNLKEQGEHSPQEFLSMQTSKLILYLVRNKTGSIYDFTKKANINCVALL